MRNLTSAGEPGGYGRHAPPKVNWWLRLTSSGWDSPQRTIEEREKARRSRLTSWIIFGLLIADLLLIPVGSGDPSTLGAVAVVGFGLLFAAALNRSGFVSFAGGLIVLLICAGVMASLVSLPDGLDVFSLPAYDLMAIAVVVAASLVSRGAAFAVAGLNVALIIVDFFLQTHASDLVQSVQTYGTLAILARPIALQVILAVVAYLWVRGTDEAIRRADRAEEIAAMEHAIVEQKRQLDIGVQQILDTHVRVANGDFSARAPTTQDNVLWQIAASLNNLLSRLQKSGQAEHQLRRTEEEVYRLASAIRDAQSGRRPIWPAPTGTAADRILELLARPAMREPQGPPPALPPQRSGSFPSEPASGYFPNAGPPPPQMPQYPPQMPQQQWPDLRPPSASPSPSPFSNPWALPADQES